MIPYILCNLFLFDMQQRVVFVDSQGNMKEIAVATLDNLSTIIADACHLYKANKVKLIGKADFANVYAQEICFISTTKYGNQYIEVEVN